MNNPLFNALGGMNGLPSNMQNIIQQFNQFKQTFKGDPKAQIQQMLNSGQVTQAQYNQAVQMANALHQMIK